ncbi:MAG: YabP/YqfC family sporulation protein [Clostridia bacterium]|nr:YabP/YqfC family sporulation protein [Clostridia bacterium]
MGFLDDLKDDLKAQGYPFPPKYRVLLLGDNVGYFEKIVGILEFSDQKIVLSLKKGSITILGQGLYIKNFCEGDVVVLGKIDSVVKDSL